MTNTIGSRRTSRIHPIRMCALCIASIQGGWKVPHNNDLEMYVWRMHGPAEHILHVRQLGYCPANVMIHLDLRGVSRKEGQRRRERRDPKQPP